MKTPTNLRDMYTFIEEAELRVEGVFNASVEESDPKCAYTEIQNLGDVLNTYFTKDTRQSLYILLGDGYKTDPVFERLRKVKEYLSKGNDIMNLLEIWGQIELFQSKLETLRGVLAIHTVSSAQGYRSPDR